MDVSKNRGTPKSSILIGFSIINHPFWGHTLFLETPTWSAQTCSNSLASCTGNQFCFSSCPRGHFGGTPNRIRYAGEHGWHVKVYPCMIIGHDISDNLTEPKLLKSTLMSGCSWLWYHIYILIWTHFSEMCLLNLLHFDFNDFLFFRSKLSVNVFFSVHCHHIWSFVWSFLGLVAFHCRGHFGESILLAFLAPRSGGDGKEMMSFWGQEIRLFLSMD